MKRPIRVKARMCCHPPRFRPTRLLPTLTALVLTAGLAGWGGYEAGLSSVHADGNRIRLALRGLLDADRRALDDARGEVQAHIDALARKAGDLEARLLRMEALGSDLVTRAKLDRDEFDFSEPPALGGPEDPAGRSIQAPELNAELTALAQRIADRESKLDLLQELMLGDELRQRGAPYGRPVKAGIITSGYGYRTDPFTGKRTFHKGLDFSGKLGTEILAAADGIVTFVGQRSGYGNTVEIAHGNGYVTRYAHNRKILVHRGDFVRQGQTISLMGHSGRATGTHLHFEVIRDDKTLDPRRFVASRKGRRETG